MVEHEKSVFSSSGLGIQKTYQCQGAERRILLTKAGESYMSKFKFGDNVTIEGTGLNCRGTVGILGRVSDILGQPVGTIGLGGRLYDTHGEAIGTVRESELPRMPTVGLTGPPSSLSDVGRPFVGERFESIGQKKVDDITRTLKDIEGGYEWFKK